MIQWDRERSCFAGFYFLSLSPLFALRSPLVYRQLLLLPCVCVVARCYVVVVDVATQQEEGTEREGTEGQEKKGCRGERLREEAFFFRFAPASSFLPSFLPPSLPCLPACMLPFLSLLLAFAALLSLLSTPSLTHTFAHPLLRSLSQPRSPPFFLSVCERKSCAGIVLQRQAREGEEGAKGSRRVKNHRRSVPASDQSSCTLSYTP